MKIKELTSLKTCCHQGRDCVIKTGWFHKFHTTFLVLGHICPDTFYGGWIKVIKLHTAINAGLRY